MHGVTIGCMADWRDFRIRMDRPCIPRGISIEQPPVMAVAPQEGEHHAPLLTRTNPSYTSTRRSVKPLSSRSFKRDCCREGSCTHTPPSGREGLLPGGFYTAESTPLLHTLSGREQAPLP